MRRRIPRRPHTGWPSIRECKNKAFAEAINDLLNKQGACTEGLEKTIQGYRDRVNRVSTKPPDNTDLNKPAACGFILS